MQKYIPIQLNKNSQMGSGIQIRLNKNPRQSFKWYKSLKSLFLWTDSLTKLGYLKSNHNSLNCTFGQPFIRYSLGISIISSSYISNLSTMKLFNCWLNPTSQCHTCKEMLMFKTQLKRQFLIKYWLILFKFSGNIDT